MRELANAMVVLRKNIASAALAAMMCCAVGLGFVATTLGTAYAQPQATLTPAQISTIQAQIAATINAVNMQQFNTMVVDPAVLALCNCAQNTNTANNPNAACENPAKNAALAQAIADLLVSLVGTYGSGAAGEITSIILASAMSAGVPATAIGAGLGKGAQQLAQANGAAAILVAQVMANEGTLDIDNCFASTVGSQQLASIALGPPTNTGAGGGGGGAPGNDAPGVIPVLATSAS